MPKSQKKAPRPAPAAHPYPDHPHGIGKGLFNIGLAVLALLWGTGAVPDARLLALGLCAIFALKGGLQIRDSLA